MHKGDTTRYKYNSSPGLGLLSNGRALRYILSSSNAVWHSSIHWKSFGFFRVWKKGRHYLANFETKSLSTTILSISICTSFTIFSSLIYLIAWVFLKFASIPQCDTINLKNLPEVTPKEHMAGFSFIRYLCKVVKDSSRSSMWFPDAGS